ncbi:MAG: hypothetical protein HC851_00715 [Acaryochloris sp. RU_4_1]|nr:hypothetical protein [Acaryochloris sp. RU_4_1]NJR53167.1 hypothetical protein [Acaryochloris sp. CRU_2_0]
MKQNSLTVLSIVALSSTLLLSCARHNPLTGQSNGSPANTKAEDSLTLTSFQQIQGTPYLLAQLSEQDPESRLSSYESSDRIGQTRNLVFLNANSLTSHRLFQTNTFVILNTTQYTHQKTKVDGQPTPTTSEGVTQWIVYQVLKQDTNGNGQLDQTDHRTIGISDAAGQGYTEVLTGVSQFFGETMAESGKLVLVYTQDGVKRVSIVDLKSRRIAVTKAMVNLGVSSQ